MGFRLLSPLVGTLLQVFCLVFPVLVLAAPEPQANPYQTLNGTWTGSGTVTPLKGAPEKVACDITYNTEGAVVTQTVRCAGADHKFAATLDLTYEGGRIDGVWREQVRGASGAVSGTANGSSIRARLSGKTFAGRMRIDVAGPRHTIEIVQRDESSGAYRPVASIAMHR
ncbi:MAG: hypothetical protein ACTSYK_05660 [Alphaproteobacteria bacterium]|jgi:hypothetical protein